MTTAPASADARSAPATRGPARADVPRGLLVATGATALALFAAYLASSAPQGPDPVDVTAASAQRWFVESATSLEVAASAAAVGAALLVVVGALLRRLVRLVDPESALADVAVAAAGVLAVELLLYSAVLGVGRAADPAEVPSQMAFAWYGLRPLSETLGDSAHLFRALLVGAVALAAHRVRYLPRWLTVLGLATAVLCAVGELGGTTGWGGFVAVWFAGLAGYLLWLPLLGVVLLARARRAG